MDVRLGLPILLLVVAVALVGSVEESLRPSADQFALWPGGPAGGGFTALAVAARMEASPELEWGTPPPGTVSLALVAVDLDAPGGAEPFWAVWNIPASRRRLDPGLPPVRRLPDGAAQANRQGGAGWSPGPRQDGPLLHRVRFVLFALPGKLVLPEDADAARVAREASLRALAVASWAVGD